MKKTGLVLIISSLIICLFLLVLAKNNLFFIPENPLIGLAEIFALWGMILFCFTFLLASRFSFLEAIFGPLDRIYKMHQILGRLTLIFLIMHFIFLILHYSDNNLMISRLVLPNDTLAYNLGIFGLWTLLIIISLTIYAKTEYQLFIRIKKFFVVPLILGALHMLLGNSDSSRYLPLTIFMSFYSFVAFISWFYREFLYTTFGPKYNYVVKNIQMLSSDILEIIFTPENKKITFLPGQFVYLEFYGLGIPKEMHPFSICSSPLDEQLRFSIKTSGDFTNQIKLVKIGDKALVYGPYGELGKQFLNMSEAVLIAGGIGITPFLSMISYYSTNSNSSNKKVNLFYCVKNESEAVFKESLIEKTKILSNFRLMPIYSEQGQHLSSQIISNILGNLTNKIFFLCGPSIMMQDLISELKEFGVSSNNIIYEDFNLR